MSLIRIVRMECKQEKTPEFLEIFELNKALIRNSGGCLHLELWQDADQSNISYTYSIWKVKKDLENYRKSDLFRKVWL